MAIVRSFGGATLLKPGAYSTSNVDNAQGADLGNNDTLMIIGEAAAGADSGINGESGARVFRASQVAQLAAHYESGDIVDAALAAVRPSITPGIGGAGNIVVYKTNASVAAIGTISLPSDDVYTNQDDARVLITPAGAQDPVSFLFGRNFLEEAPVAEETLIRINTNAPSVIEASTITLTPGGGGAAVVFTFGVTGANIITDSLTTAAAIATAAAAVIDADTNFTADAQGAIITIANVIVGTATDAVVVDGLLTDDIDPLEIVRVTQGAVRSTGVNLAAAINANPALNTFVTAEAVGQIVTLTAKPGDSGNEIAISSEDVLITFSADTLLGGASNLGTTTTAAFAESLEDAFNFDVNVIVPLFSSDVGPATGILQINEVLFNLRAHLILRSGVETRKEAQGIVGVRNADWRAVYNDPDDGISLFRSELMQVCLQDVRVAGPTGALEWKGPEIMACLLAGIRLGSEVGEPLTFKFVNASGVGHFINSETGLSQATDLFRPGFDFNEAIENGLTFTELAGGGGNRVVVDNTSYALDASFVFNRGSVVEAAQFVSRSSREVLEAIFVGQKVSNGAADSLKNVLRNHLRALNDLNIITASIDAPFGFVEETFTVDIVGNTVNVAVEIKPVQGLDFVFITFTLGNITQSA